MMYFYEVGYSSYEEAPCYTLMSEKEYTQKEFDELVADCMIEAYFIETAVHKKRLVDNNVEIDPEEYDFHNKIEHLLSPGIEILKIKHGFIEPVSKCKFQPFGWASIKDTDDWSSDAKNDIQLNIVRERFKIHERDKRINDII